MTSDEIDDDLLEVFGAEVMRFTRRTMVSGPPDAVLDLSAFRILRLLVESGPRTMGELGEELQLEQSTVSRQTSAAIRRGLVEADVPSGRGQRTHRATALGRADYAHDLQLRSSAYRAALADLGADRTRALVEGLTAFSEALDRAENDSAS